MSSGVNDHMHDCLMWRRQDIFAYNKIKSAFASFELDAIMPSKEYLQEYKNYKSLKEGKDWMFGSRVPHRDIVVEVINFYRWKVEEKLENNLHKTQNLLDRYRKNRKTLEENKLKAE